MLANGGDPDEILHNVFMLANSKDPDEMPPYAAFHLGLHCLLIKYLPVTRMNRVIIKQIFLQEFNFPFIF